MRDTVEYHDGRIEVVQQVIKIYDRWLYDGQNAEAILIEISSLCKEIEHNSYKEQEKILADMAEQDSKRAGQPAERSEHE